MSQPSIHFELRGNRSCRHLSILAYWTSGYEESPSRRVLEYETKYCPVGRGSFPKPDAKLQLFSYMTKKTNIKDIIHITMDNIIYNIDNMDTKKPHNCL